MLQTILGAVLAIATTIVIEYVRRPKLSLSLIPAVDVPYPTGHPLATSARYLLVSCTNRPLPFIFRWMSRNPALQCHGTVTFHHLDGQNIFGRTMPMRWSGTTEPVPLILLGANPGRIIDPNRMSVESRIDIHAGESGRADTAVKFDNESECYGWSNLNYFSQPQWRNPDWKIPQGRYLVRLDVVCSGGRCAGVFRLINDVDQKDFRLELCQPEDLKKMRNATI